MRSEKEVRDYIGYLKKEIETAEEYRMEEHKNGRWPKSSIEIRLYEHKKIMEALYWVLGENK